MRLAALLSWVASACSVDTGNSPDNPNREDPPAGYPTGTARYWTVIDEATGDVLSTGCANLPIPTVQAVVGQRLVYQITEEVVSKEQGNDVASDWWCTDEMLVRRSVALRVDKLSCWVMPSEGPIRVDRWEVIPAARMAPPVSTSLMAGSGYRLFLEVLDYGRLVLSPNSTCAVKERAILQVTE